MIQKCNAYFKNNRKELLETKNTIIQINSSVAMLEGIIEHTSQKIEEKDRK